MCGQVLLKQLDIGEECPVVDDVIQNSNLSQYVYYAVAWIAREIKTRDNI
jgi:hypothetical protein